MSEAIHCESSRPLNIAPPMRMRSGQVVGWAPLMGLPAAVLILRANLAPCACMWLLAAAIFAGCKWQTWWEARSSNLAARSWKRGAAYFFLWPGMEPGEFFTSVARKRSVPARDWLAASARALAGFVLIWTGARMISLRHPLLGGWAGMIGLVLFLHFGTFHLAALLWQRAGIPVKPIMRRPLASRSLSELWGRRWNLGFRRLSHAWVFQPLQKRFGVAIGTLGAFLASGLLHDLVISVPAAAGYGLPTAYFVAQGLGVVAERSETGKRLGLGRGVKGWLWTALVAIGPLYWFFHPWFVVRVLVPFLRAIAG